MKTYHITVMSIDPADTSEDPHQKYGLTVEANNETEARTKGAEQFKRQYKGLPIFWVRAFEQ